MKARAAMLVLWPSFLIAGVMSAVVFAFVDPLEVSILGDHFFDREYLYALGFLFFWLIASLSSLMTLYLLPNRSFLTDSDPTF